MLANTVSTIDANATGWTRCEGWIAVFDILGFKNNAARAGNYFLAQEVTWLHDINNFFQNNLPYYNKHEGTLHSGLAYKILQDTIVIYSNSLDLKDARPLHNICISFFDYTCGKRIPVTGAISCGQFRIFANENTLSVSGPAFVEAFNYGNALAGPGVILTPSGAQVFHEYDIKPIRNNFVAASPGDIKEKNREGIPIENAFMSRLQPSEASFEPPTIEFLGEMQSRAPEEVKPKYDYSINFLNAHHKKITT